jgi:thiamine-monophosphate kinase
MSEFDYIRWIRQQRSSQPRVLLGPGDDAAAIDWTSGLPVLATTDVLTDGVDFRLGEVEPRRIGRKALAVNLSDIAAMAGRPVAALVGVVLPRHGGVDLPRELYLGMRELADQFDTALVGGDTNSWEGPLVIAVTLLGEPKGNGPVTRRGARPGDWLLATGAFGYSIRGHHLDFTPRVREAQILHTHARLHAMIDVSDGLAADVNHLCEESQCGAVLWADAIPRRENAPLEHALSDGEDFELVFAVSPDDGERLLRDQPIPDLSHIGVCVASGLWLEQAGARQPLEPRGWVHTFG